MGDLMAKEELLDEDLTPARKFKLDNFEGPLDLLLKLIKDAKLDIKTVKLAEITSQYLEVISDMTNLDMVEACGFINIAATLVEIKSKSLLPREEEENDEPEIPEEILLKLRLEEYQLLQEASVKLKEIEDVNKYYKAPDETVGDYRYVLKQMTLDALLDAFTKMMQRIEIKEAKVEHKTIQKDRFTVDDKIHEIKEVVRQKKKVVFTELFDSDYSKIEVITCFMALLELLKLQQIKVSQEENYSEIIINLAEENTNEQTA